MTDRPPHPGSRPETLEFGFAEARELRQQARNLAQDLRGVRGVLDTGLHDLAGSNFAGLFAAWLVKAGADVDGDLGTFADQLDDQADRIDDIISTARTRIDTRERSIDSWDQRYRAWRDWTEPAAS